MIKGDEEMKKYKGYQIYRHLEEMDREADEVIFKIYEVHPDMRVYNRNKEVCCDIVLYHYYNTEPFFKGIYVSPSIPEELIPKLLKKHFGL